MAVSYMDFTSPDVQFTYDLSQNLFFKKNDHNYINALSVNQLNTLGNASLLDIFLSKGNVVEPHIHQNATELVYCISGSAAVSMINPFTKELLTFTIAPGQVANVPQGWWHYELALADGTHLLAVFDAPVPEFIPASDMLRLTPANVFAHTYCLDEAKVKETLAPIADTVVIGPPNGCKQPGMRQPAEAGPQAYAPYPAYAYPGQPQPVPAVPYATQPAGVNYRQPGVNAAYSAPAYPNGPYAPGAYGPTGNEWFF